MPRWRALPDELDPQVREFAEQLRRVVDRTGLSLAAVADRTGYSRTSWERYLDGRLLAPKGAIVALAEVTGTPPIHLTTMWELAERAWSRSEMRHDRTMEAGRIAQARAALGEFGPPPPEVREEPAEARVAVTPGVAGPAGVSDGGSGSGRVALFLAGVVGVVIVVVGAFLLTDGGDPQQAVGTVKSPSPSAGSATSMTVLPSGARCGGAGCTGKDAEEMGCSGDLVETVRSATVGAVLVEVRYSETCGAAWGRITQAAPGDGVRVTAGSVRQTGAITVAGDTIAYTPMVAVRDAADATACAVLASGRQGCTP
ncbi:Helix-turn-helix domain-containing protein [Streptomyces sp. yr375]|uniref:helix-turn-helix domain-containing protein n=1 Tax=Streptomyces sp. yr375 TaxID=1761906 RepID=UPI0008AC7984|nr:XRE family transcriptional regulator [Streptomyces sp. yr375]SER35907.1 Helix-turn-helix domain-containing protein [Streptomyces sp. yr375]